MEHLGGDTDPSAVPPRKMDRRVGTQISKDGDVDLEYAFRMTKRARQIEGARERGDLWKDLGLSVERFCFLGKLLKFCLTLMSSIIFFSGMLSLMNPN